MDVNLYRWIGGFLPVKNAVFAVKFIMIWVVENENGSVHIVMLYINVMLMRLKIF